MKKITFLIISILLVLFVYPRNSRNIQAELFYVKFYSPSEGPYVETYLSVFGESVKYIKTDDGKYQGAIEVTMIFSQDSIVKNYDKYELLSPKIEDTTNINFSFLDQQRFSLPNGIYEYEIRISDLNKDSKPYKVVQTLEINFPNDKITISGIELVESFQKTTEPNILSKSGYDLIPYVHNFFPDNIDNLTFYAEIYNTETVWGTDQKFLINYFIEAYETGKRLTDFVRFERETTKNVNILFAQFDINRLPSGNYYLVIEVRDRKNELIASNKLFFQRSNPDVKVDINDFAGLSPENTFVAKMTDRDTLLEYIHCLTPISTNIERRVVKYQIEKADIETMQRYFLNFWLNRDELNPEYAWEQYFSLVTFVDEQFGYPGKRGGKKGYETDMGCVYLKYGPPNTITDRPFDASSSGMTINDGGEVGPDRGSVPYQIWHYYTLNNQRNKKFVFANPNLASHDYVLIHSNVPGEINNANWQDELVRIKEGLRLPNSDSEKYKGQSGKYYNDPR